LFEAIRVLREFYRTLNEPRLEEPEAIVNDYPDVGMYNAMWQQIMDDLTIIFTELENVETLTVANFNFMTTESNRLKARLKAVSSKLGDYILYTDNPSRDALFFKDSFNDLSKIDVGTGLLNETECKIGQDEGIVTLPTKNEFASVISVTEKPVINPNSNGRKGNNNEIGALWNGDVMMVLDNNPDTWFEYERVVGEVSDTKQSLILDMTVNLGEPQIVNNVVVNPNNFGTKTTIIIKEIETSIDGDVFTSIKDDIPIAGFVTEDEENIFVLAPSTSKYAGQGIYTFTPRKVKYVHFVFEQPEAYSISTPQGNRLRYAIGIRDLNISAFKYEPKGEFISRPFEPGEEIRKVLLQTNQNPSEKSDIADVAWFVSPDDGQTWHKIQPSERGVDSGIVSAVPEVITFNGDASNNITTPAPVDSIRVKGILERDDDAFTPGSSSFRKTVLSKSEVHQVPTTSPFKFTLEENPVQGTISVIDPLYGSRGISQQGYSISQSQQDHRLYKLPELFQNVPWPMYKEYQGNNVWQTKRVSGTPFAIVEVAGEKWTHATTGVNLEGTGDKQYNFNPTTGELSLSAPPENATVSIYFDAERLTPSAAQNSHRAKLDFATSNNKDSMTIKRYDEILSHTEILPRGATVVRLKHGMLVEDSVAMIGLALNQADGYTATPKTYLNGRDELLASTDWSVDETNGIIFLARPTPVNRDISIFYRWQPIYVLADTDWEWGSDDALNDSVIIKETAWTTQTQKDIILGITTSGTVIDLPHMSIVDGSVKPVLTISGATPSVSEDPFFKEIKHIDGKTEFGGDILSTTQTVPLLSSGSNVFNLVEDIVLSEDYPVSFTASGIFLNENASPSSTGDYYVDRTANTVTVITDKAETNTGTMSYWYQNPDFDTEGLYSVDNSLGRVYLQRSLDPNNTGAWSLKVDYNFVDFRAEYAIARRLDEIDYDVDITTNEIAIKDREVLGFLVIPKGGLAEKVPYYVVNYDYVAETREDIGQLKDFFSPIVKDYALKVLTKGRIF
jgi:hypothetical protein